MAQFFSNIWTNFVTWLSNALSAVFQPVLQQFHDLANYLGTLFNSIWTQIQAWLQQFWDWLEKVFGTLIQAIVNGFNSLYDLLVKIFTAVYLFFDGLMYFVHKVFNIAILIVQLIFSFFNLLKSLGEGLITTFSNLSFTGSTANFSLNPTWQTYFSYGVGILHTMGFDIVAGIITFFIWIWTAWIVIRIIGFGR
jgi:hypothetical protein